MNRYLIKKIMVPFCYQSEMSGICNTEVHHVVWYRKEFEVEKSRLKDKSLLLKFGAVDYEAEVYINQIHAAGHRGGHTPFEADITGLVLEGKNVITVKVMDYSDEDKPRGKQTGQEKICMLVHANNRNMAECLAGVCRKNLYKTNKSNSRSGTE